MWIELDSRTLNNVNCLTVDPSRAIMVVVEEATFSTLLQVMAEQNIIAGFAMLKIGLNSSENQDQHPKYRIIRGH